MGPPVTKSVETCQVLTPKRELLYTDKDKESVRIRFICVYPCAICACFGKSLSSYHTPTCVGGRGGVQSANVKGRMYVNLITGVDQPGHYRLPIV